MTAAVVGAGMALCGVLAVGCVVDKLLARIPAVERYIESLPLGKGDDGA